MEKSFSRHLYWHVADETTYIVFDVQEVPFKGQQDLFQNTLQKVHRRLNIPVPVAAQRLNAASVSECRQTTCLGTQTESDCCFMKLESTRC